MSQKVAIIIGAGPAGLTAALELLERSDIKPVILERSKDIGGLSRTVNYKGNRIDIGPHRFFSKSTRVMEWWQRVMPIQAAPSGRVEIAYQNKRTSVAVDEAAPDPSRVDLVMLVRTRLSRILYLRSFFSYPLSASRESFLNLGFVRVARILVSYLKAALFPVRPEKSLEDFLINRFGRELYLTFFKDYTEKVWGVACAEISAEWGQQRIKGLSIGAAIAHALKALVRKDAHGDSANVETSLIEQFLYPKLGPGQLWEEVARRIRAKGGEILLQRQVRSIQVIGGLARRVTVVYDASGATEEHFGDYVFSTMPVKDLIAGMDGDVVPQEVREVAQGLLYRDLVLVGVLLKKLTVRTKRDAAPLSMVPDNWIYIQERDVKLGRLQIYNNWSPFMLNAPDTVWLGLEYFCDEGDEMWRRSDEEFSGFAIDELIKIDFAAREDVLDSTIIRVSKSYPAYFGAYNRFGVIREYLDGIENLFPIGRNGMHKYNNSDHSMLTAMTAVDNIIGGVRSKDNVWAVNTEDEYHERE